MGTLSFIISPDCKHFDQKQFYISEYEYKGTMAEWEATMNEHWVYRRTAKVICSDGVIDNTIIKKKGRKN